MIVGYYSMKIEMVKTKSNGLVGSNTTFNHIFQVLSTYSTLLNLLNFEHPLHHYNPCLMMMGSGQLLTLSIHQCTMLQIQKKVANRFFLLSWTNFSIFIIVLKIPSAYSIACLKCTPTLNNAIKCQ